MYNVYYKVSSPFYQYKDITDILDEAIHMLNAVPSINDITIYVHDQSLINGVLRGVPGISISGTSYSYNGVSGEIHTPRTYKPKAAPKSEIIVGVLPLSKDLFPIESSNSIAAIYVVPEYPEGQDSSDDWLFVHSAQDVSTGAIRGASSTVTSLENRVIGYLKHESVYGSPLHHSTMKVYIKRQHNLLQKHGIHSDYLTIIRQCLLRGYSHKDAYVVAEILSAKSAYSLRSNTDYNALFTAVDDPRWEVN